MSAYKEKRRRSSGRYYPRRKSPYLPKINRAGGGYSGPRSYTRHHDFKYSSGEQQPREPKTEIGSYVRSPVEHYSEKSTQVQPDIEALLEELKRSRDPALLDEVTQRLNYETEQMENAARIPEMETTAEPMEDHLTNDSSANPDIDDGEIWMTADEVRQIDETFRASEEAETQRIDGFFDWIEETTRNPSSEQFEVMEPLGSPVLQETGIETYTPSTLESTLNDLDGLALELYANPFETKLEEEPVETENDAY